MSDVITSVRQLIQDLVAPDLKAANAKLEGLKELIEANLKLTEANHKHATERTDLLLKLAQERTDAQHNALTTQLEAFRAEMRSEFASLRAQSTLQVRESVGPLEGRLQVLEATRTPR
jgi:hypothetical protein